MPRTTRFVPTRWCLGVRSQAERSYPHGRILQMTDMPPEAVDAVVRVWQAILAELHPDSGSIRVTSELERNGMPVLGTTTREIHRLAAKDDLDTFADRRKAA